MFAARILIAVFFALPAFAEAPAAPAAAKDIPASVWQISQDGSALHLESQWQCPAAFGDYRRDELHVYDRYGLDVSCNYMHVNGRDDITLYITKSTGGDITAAFEAAKDAMVKRTPDSVALPDSAQRTFPSTRPWLHAVNAIYGGKAHDGVWYAWMGDWLFEIRATWPANGDAQTMADLTRMVETAESTAGRHLNLCAKSKLPERTGTVITDKAEIMGDIVLFGAMWGEGSVIVKDPKGNVTGTKSPPQPGSWCVEGPVDGVSRPFLMWHAVGPSGETQAFDRITGATMAEPPVFESALNPLEGVLGRLVDKKPTYVVSRISGDEVAFYALFSDRPGAASLAAVVMAWIEGKAKPLAKINPKTNSVQMFTGDQK